MTRLLRGAFVIARRDLGATVLSKTFLFFLLGPLFPLLFGGIFGGIGASVASENEKPVVAVVSSAADFAALKAARSQLGQAIDDNGLLRLVHYAPQGDAQVQVRRLLATRHPAIRSVLTGGLAAPHLTGPLAAPTLGGFGTVTDLGLQLWIQFKGVSFTVVYSAVLSYVIFKGIAVTMGLRVDEEQEQIGLDLSLHEERGYNLS